MAVPTLGTPATAAGSSTGVGATTITVDTPADLADGDHLLVMVSRKGASSSAVTSWGADADLGTAIYENNAATDQIHYAAWLIHCPSAAAVQANWTFTPTGGGTPTGIAAAAVAVKGANSAAPVDVIGAQEQNPGGSIITWAGLTTTGADRLYVGHGAHQRITTYSSLTAGLTEAANVPTDHTTAGSNITLELVERDVAAAGAVAQQSATASTTGDWRSRSIAFAPSSLTAVAGDDQTAEAGEYVTLDGTASPLATGYQWTQTGGGTPVIFDDATAGVTHFHAPRVSGAPVGLVFELEVDDGVATATDTVTVTVNPPPLPTLSLQVLDATGNPL